MITNKLFICRAYILVVVGSAANSHQRTPRVEVLSKPNSNKCGLETTPSRLGIQFLPCNARILQVVGLAADFA